MLHDRNNPETVMRTGHRGGWNSNYIALEMLLFGYYHISRRS